MLPSMTLDTECPHAAEHADLCLDETEDTYLKEVLDHAFLRIIVVC